MTAFTFPVVNGVSTAHFVFSPPKNGFEENFNAINTSNADLHYAANPRLAYAYFLAMAPNGGKNRMALSAAICPPPASAAGLAVIYQAAQSGALAEQPGDPTLLKAVPGYKNVQPPHIGK